MSLTLSPVELFAEIRAAAAEAAAARTAAEASHSDEACDDCWAAFSAANDRLFALVEQAELRGVMADLLAYLTVTYGG